MGNAEPLVADCDVEKAEKAEKVEDMTYTGDGYPRYSIPRYSIRSSMHSELSSVGTAVLDSLGLKPPMRKKFGDNMFGYLQKDEDSPTTRSKSMDFGSYNVVKAEKADDSRKIQKWASKSA